MATVFLARDLKHERDVAVKVLRSDLAAVLGAERFLKEIRITAQLDHPNILTLIDSGAVDGLLYYVLPLVRGESLRQRLERERQLGIEDALTITRNIASALDYAHRQGVVHRDIKPENIMIHEGVATLMDFGIAVAVKEAGGNRLTETGLSLGTPQYMSPEQATGDRTLDARSDIYSLAAVLYEMLTGEPPHSGPTVQAVIAKLLTEKPTRIRVLRDTVPLEIDAAVMRALSKTPADRFPSAGEFVRALSVPITEAPTRRKTKWIPAAIAVAALLVIAVFAGKMFSRSSSRPIEPERVQMTNAGNVRAPSISPDGTRFAFGEKLCDENEACTYQVVIQDVAGNGRLVLAKGLAGVYSTGWTLDNRFVIYSASGEKGWGVYAIPTLGGSPRRLGCCGGEILRGDTALILTATTPRDSVGWIKLVTVSDGQPHDSIPFRKPGLQTWAFPGGEGPLFTVFSGVYGDPTRSIRLIDRKGNEVDKLELPVTSGTLQAAKWDRSSNALILALPPNRATSANHIVRVRIDGNRIVPRTDTLVHNIEMAEGWFDLQSDGSTLVFQHGPFEATLQAYQQGKGASPSRKPRVLLNSTNKLGGRISPDGSRILISRQSVIDGKTGSQFSIIPFDGGSANSISATIENVGDFEWTLDGSAILLSRVPGPNSTTISVIDTLGRMRDIAKLPKSYFGLDAMHDGSIVLLEGDGINVARLNMSGQVLSAWKAPPWVAQLGRFTDSPDGKTMAALGWYQGFDSVVVVRIDVASGAASQMANIPNEGYSRITWLNDGSLLFDLREDRGVQGLYRIIPGGRPTRLGPLPFYPAHFSYSLDGKRVAAFTGEEKGDVYLIRNFGEIAKSLR
jgi:hypothetical protein